MQAGQCGKQMGTQFGEAVCSEHSTSGGGENFGNNDAQLGRMNVI
jgi:hypothetical protein